MTTRSAIAWVIKQELDKHQGLCRADMTSHEAVLDVRCLTQYQRWLKRFKIQVLHDTVEMYDFDSNRDDVFHLADPDMLERIVVKIMERVK